jgi:hypothetical protein
MAGRQATRAFEAERESQLKRLKKSKRHNADENLGVGEEEFDDEPPPPSPMLEEEEGDEEAEEEADAEEVDLGGAASADGGKGGRAKAAKRAGKHSTGNVGFGYKKFENKRAIRLAAKCKAGDTIACYEVRASAKVCARAGCQQLALRTSSSCIASAERRRGDAAADGGGADGARRQAGEARGSVALRRVARGGREPRRG